MHRAGLACAALLLLAAPARADLARPACEALGRWASSPERHAAWSPNPLRLDARPRLVALLAAPATASLFGRPLPDWTAEQARALAPHIARCAETLRARNRPGAAALGQLRPLFQRDLPAFLADLAAARTALPQRLAELDAAPPSPGLLRFHRALAALGPAPDSAPRAQQAARALAEPARSPALALIEALRDLPEAELAPLLDAAAARIPPLQAALAAALIAAAEAAPAGPEGLAELERLAAALAQQAAELGPVHAARIEAALAARRAAIAEALGTALLAELAAIPATLAGAARLERLEQAATSQAEALGEAGLRAVLAALAARREAFGAEVLAALLGDIAATPPSAAGLAELARLEMDSAPPELVRLLGPEGIARLRREATARRRALAPDVVAALLPRIAAIPADHRAYAALDAAVAPQTLALLPPADALRVSAALVARRRAVTEALLAEFRRSLAALPASEAGLIRIERELLPALDDWPPSAAAERARFAVLARERRQAILAALNRAEAGALAERTELPAARPR